MEANQLSDEEFQQLKNEFKDSETTVSRKIEASKQLMAHFLRKFKYVLMKRFNDGEQLSDRQLALLAYDDDVDERVLQKLKERSLTESLRDEYVQVYLQDRFKQQIKFQSGSIILNLGHHIYQFGWAGFKQTLQTDTSKTVFKKILPIDMLVNNSLTLSFAGAGFFFLYDLGRSLYLWYYEKISGKQFAKRMISSLFSNAGAGVGTYVGMTLGALIGPIGGVIAGLLIGAAASIGLSFLATFCNEKIWRSFDDEEKEKIIQELNEKARATLGVTLADDFKAITRSWKTMVLQHHPDKHPNATAKEKEAFGVKFQEIHLAYRTLREEELRSKRISETEIHNIEKSNPLLIVAQDGWFDELEEENESF